jgi:hypothetical protein
MKGIQRPNLGAVERMTIRKPGLVFVENLADGVAGPENSRFARWHACVPVFFIELIQTVFRVASVRLQKDHMRLYFMRHLKSTPGTRPIVSMRQARLAQPTIPRTHHPSCFEILGTLQVAFWYRVATCFIGCKAVVHAHRFDFAPRCIAGPIIQGAEEGFHREVALFLPHAIDRKSSKYRTVLQMRWTDEQ